MPLWKCDSCHHEWEGDRKWGVCDWCGSTGHILDSKTPLEKLISKLFNKKREKK
jgi:hypothetical protein